MGIPSLLQLLKPVTETVNIGTTFRGKVVAVDASCWYVFPARNVFVNDRDCSPRPLWRPGCTAPLTHAPQTCAWSARLRGTRCGA